jgi:vitamin B12 transporter
MVSLLTFSSALSSALLAMAEPSTPIHTESAVVVTANRSERQLHETLASVELVNREQIVRSQARDILELLRRFAGIDIARTGGPGSQTSVFMRGTNSNHVLVLIDGARASSSASGAFSWEQLPVQHIERIEIVRGPRAALYGSEAIGGVIQIITRSGLNPSMFVGVGSERDGEFALGQGFGTERNNVHIGISRRDRRGFSAQNVNGFAFDPDRDGVESDRLSLHGNFSLSEVLTLEPTLLGTNNDIEFDQGVSALRYRVSSATLRFDQNQAWRHVLQLGYARETLTTEAFDSVFESRRHQGEWQSTWLASDHSSWIFALGSMREDGASEDLAGNASYDQDRDRWHALAQYSFDEGSNRFDASLRHDDDDFFGSENTYQLAFGQDLERWSWHASHGEGYRAPNLNELFSPGFGGSFAGNPALKPEQSRSTELMARMPLGIGAFSGSLARTHVDQLIAFSGPRFQAINIRRAEIDTAEIAYQFERTQETGWSGRFSTTWLDAIDATSKTRLLRRARNKLSAEADWQLSENLSVGALLLYAGKRPELGATSLGAYTTFDLRARYQFRPAWFLEASGENLSDENYELARGFNTPGREFRVSLRYGL